MSSCLARRLSGLFPILAAFAVAAQEPFPLANPAPTTAPSAPFVVPAGTSQTLVIDLLTLFQQGQPATFGRWDMVALDPTGENVFIPAEMPLGAGILRYHLATGATQMLLLGNRSEMRQPDPAQFDPANDDFRYFDPCTYTPWGTVITAEEALGGRLFEIINPHDPVGPFDVVWHSSIPAVAHEGLRFDSSGALYFVDESYSGSIYKFVPTVPGDLGAGQSFVLVVDAFTGNPTLEWNAVANQGIPRVGSATWQPLTDAAGQPLTATSPFVFVTAQSGNAAADEVNGTPYGRPEDVDVGRLANGNEVLYVALTAENVVLSIELLTPGTCVVRRFCDYDTVDLATGVDVNPEQNAANPYAGSGAFAFPDNLTIDAFGNVYVVEDSVPGDIWKCFDDDGDGVAESMGRFASLGIANSEPTGLIRDPVDPYRFYICVQHPIDGNESLWTLQTRPYPGRDDDVVLRSGINQQPPNAWPAEFVKGLGDGDDIHLEIRSDGGSLVGVTYAVLLQAAPTLALSQSLPGFWLSPALPMFVLDAGAAPAGLPIPGSSSRLSVPVGLSGFNAAVQGVVLTPTAGLSFTDAHAFVVE